VFAEPACLLTGQVPRKNGMIGLAHRGATLRDPSRHLANILRRLGYVTALSGVQHDFKGPALADLPYDEVLAEVGVDDVAEADPHLADAAAAYLGREHDKPFFSRAASSPPIAPPGKPINVATPPPRHWVTRPPSWCRPICLMFLKFGRISPTTTSPSTGSKRRRSAASHGVTSAHACCWVGW
jgi:hypothetical protein